MGHLPIYIMNIAWALVVYWLGYSAGKKSVA